MKSDIARPDPIMLSDPIMLLKLSGKRTVTGQNSGELYTKKHRRGNPNL